MCEKCARLAKKLGPPILLSPGQVKLYAFRLLAGQPIPLFREFAANVAVEAAVHRILQRRSTRKSYRRKGRRVDQGDAEW